MLSKGWGRGLLGFFGMCWAMALTCILMAVAPGYASGLDEIMLGGLPPGTWRATYLTTFVLFTFLPVLVAQDVATTSSSCDILMTKINVARRKHGPEANLVITWLESSLKELVRISLKRALCCVFLLLTSCLVLFRIEGKGSAS